MKKVLGTIPDFGVIFHMDYSENISTSPKYEPRDAHFNKKRISLHCTVAHEINNNKYVWPSVMINNTIMLLLGLLLMV